LELIILKRAIAAISFAHYQENKRKDQTGKHLFHFLKKSSFGRLHGIYISAKHESSRRNVLQVLSLPILACKGFLCGWIDLHHFVWLEAAV